MQHSPVTHILEDDALLDDDLRRFLARLNYRDAQELKRIFTTHPAPIVAFRLMQATLNSIQTHDRPKCTVCT